MKQRSHKGRIAVGPHGELLFSVCLGGEKGMGDQKWAWRMVNPWLALYKLGLHKEPPPHSAKTQLAPHWTADRRCSTLFCLCESWELELDSLLLLLLKLGTSTSLIQNKGVWKVRVLSHSTFFLKKDFLWSLKEKGSNNDILFQELLEQSTRLKQNFIAKLWTCKQNLNHCDRSWL